MNADAMLTIKEVLARSTAWLAGKEIESARLDAELLLSDVLKMPRLDLYMYWDRSLNDAEKQAYRALLKRRSEHEPVAYILGCKEFFSMAFIVTPAVLIPRPETELLVEWVLECIGEETDLEGNETLIRIADIGTGSGAIAIALAASLPDVEIIATDICPDALAVAQQNANKHDVTDQIEFRNTSLLDGVEGKFDWILSNPPYIPETDRPALSPDVAKYEPQQALFSGPDGLDTIRQLIPQAAEKLAPGGRFAMEIGAGQAAAVRKLFDADSRFTNLRIIPDYQRIERIVTAVRM